MGQSGRQQEGQPATAVEPDIYQLARVVATLATGMAPAAGQSGALQRHRELGDLGDVLEQALDEEPSDRFSNAGAFLAALRAARPPARPEPAPTPTETQPSRSQTVHAVQPMQTSRGQSKGWVAKFAKGLGVSLGVAGAIIVFLALSLMMLVAFALCGLCSSLGVQ